MKSIFSLPNLTIAVILLSLPEIRGQSIQFVINSTGYPTSSVATVGNQYIEYSVGEFYTTNGVNTKVVSPDTTTRIKTVVGICQPSIKIINSLPSVFDEHFKIQVYPNPVQSTLSVETDYAKFKRTKILNSTGQILFETNFEKTINVSELPDGTFLIQFITDETQFTKTIKIIKQ